MIKTDIPRLFYKKDIFGIVLVVFVTAVLLMVKFIPTSSEGKKYAEVTVDGNSVLKIELTADMEPSEVPIENGFDTVLEVNDGEVWIKSSECEDQVCVHSGKISNKGASIVCLPAKTVVKIVGEQSDEAKIDGITY